jgi:Domain of unknown function (DUF4422)
MRLKIYSCHYTAPDRVVATDLFQTFVSGFVPVEDPSVISDAHGDGIPHDNRYSELRHHYFAWKNLLADVDYIGFEHYRRAFFLLPSPGEHLQRSYPELYELHCFDASYKSQHFHVNSKVFNRYLDYREAFTPMEVDRLLGLIEQYDILTVRPTPMDVQAQWGLLFGKESWDWLTTAADNSKFMRRQAQLESGPINLGYWLNCYIMKKDYFAEYMDFAFESIAGFEALSTRPATFRLYGNVAERLFSIYLNRKRLENPMLRVLELPVIFRRTELDPDGASISHDFRSDLDEAEKRGAQRVTALSHAR